MAPVNLTTLSNMPVASETLLSPDKKEMRFAVSPIMSTYLVAIVVGDFDFVEGKTADGGIHVRVYAPPDQKEEGRFALGVATRSLDFYAGYFGVQYPLPKMDLIAISDFAAGAMENWGLVTFKERALLVHPTETSAEVRQSTAHVVAHELAHQVGRLAACAAADRLTDLLLSGSGI